MGTRATNEKNVLLFDEFDVVFCEHIKELCHRCLLSFLRMITALEAVFSWDSRAFLLFFVIVSYNLRM